jgi:hypothetical protein
VGLFFRREVFKGVAEQFDVDLGAGTALPAGEETDLVLRVLSAGARGRYEPSILVFHEIERPSKNGMQDKLRRERAFAYVMTKNLLKGSPSIAWLFGRHLVKEGVRSLVSHEARLGIVEQVAGIRLAWQARRN